MCRVRYRGTLCAGSDTGGPRVLGLTQGDPVCWVCVIQGDRTPCARGRPGSEPGVHGLQGAQAPPSGRDWLVVVQALQHRWVGLQAAPGCGMCPR